MERRLAAVFRVAGASRQDEEAQVGKQSSLSRPQDQRYLQRRPSPDHQVSPARVQGFPKRDLEGGVFPGQWAGPGVNQQEALAPGLARAPQGHPGPI